MATPFLDTFTGSGDLSTHSPDVGGAYTLAAGSAGTLSDAVLDGAGGLLMSSSMGGVADIYVDSAISAVSGTYSIEYKVTVTALSGGAYAAYFDVWTADSATGVSMVEAYLSYNITTYLWTLEVWVIPTTGPDFYAQIDATALVTLNVEHTILMEVAPGGCQFSFDGSVVASTAVIPDVPHDQVTLVAFSPGMGTTGTLNSVTVDAPGADSAPIATTESGDTASIFSDAFVAATESGDTASVTAAVTTGAAIAAVESSDTAVLYGGAYIATTESGDTAVVAANSNPARIAAVEGSDTAAATGWTVLVGTMTAGEGPAQRILAFGSSSAAVEYGVLGTGPVAIIIAYGGGVADGEFPMATISAAGVSTLIGTLDQDGPKATIVASGATTLLGTLNEVWRAKYLVTAYGGGVAEGEFPAATITASGATGFVGVVAGEFPRALITALGVTPTWGRIAAVESSDTMPQPGVMIGTGPRATMLGLGRITVTTEYEAYSVTLIPTEKGTSTATTRYTNYPFDQIVRWNNTYYGVAADGLYALGGDDFDGDPILAVAQTASTDHGVPEVKHAVALHLAGRMGADFDVTVVANEEEDEFLYHAAPLVKTGARNYRCKFGKGVKARYWAYRFQNTEGEDFALDTMTPEVAVSRRIV